MEKTQCTRRRDYRTFCRFQNKIETERFLDELKDRLGKFNLSLHPEKTRFIEFGRYAAARRKAQGQGN